MGRKGGSGEWGGGGGGELRTTRASEPKERSSGDLEAGWTWQPTAETGVSAEGQRPWTGRGRHVQLHLAIMDCGRAHC